MIQNIFSVLTEKGCYKVILPFWEVDYIQGMLAKEGKPYELPMLKAMSKELLEGDLVLDVGANIGNHTLYLSAVCGCRIIAFEPNPDLCIPLRQSIELNNLLDKVHLHEVGVGSAPGKACFSALNPENLGGQSLSIILPEQGSIDVITLDSLAIIDTVRAIKIDVEGMELDVLKGGLELIRRDKPLLYIEAQTEGDFLGLHDLLVSSGYVYWNTFNATPTHFFIHINELTEERIVQHCFDNGKNTYNQASALNILKEKLKDANDKYRHAHEQIDILKDKLAAANDKYRSVTSDYQVMKDKLCSEIEQLKLVVEDVEPKTIGVESFLLGLDFSIAEYSEG
ncbi:FkbM family methyltransferase [uncultured Amphritea sp.]|uniref:FkbM family methyltransferase n=1 Tax=uncultured Amphritea sp. TaxID=981605 RepID=UPI00262CEE4E|nr:FkbM family methyltransferase [uncultured Amphritea sp.]